MKTLKNITLVFTSALIAIFIYANVRTLSPTENLAQANLVSFSLEGILNAAEIKSLEKNITNAGGVTACTISSAGNIASIVYHPEKISKEQLSKRFSLAGTVEATELKFESKGGCPIQAMNSSVGSFISVLDLRN